MTRPSNPPFVVFTDLDGTLLDHHDYSWQAAAPAIERLRRHGIPLVLNSSKTRAEMAALRRELGNIDPFVVENGSTLYSPVGYFERLTPPETDGEAEPFVVEHLGPSRAEWLETLHGIREREGFDFAGFADWDVEGIRQHTDLTPDAARAASERDGTEPILWLDQNHSPDALAQALEPHGLKLVRGGRFFHVMGPVDKGRASKNLLERYRRIHPKIRTIALGDSANDLEMLRAADFPVVIPRAFAESLDPGPLPNLLRAPKPGAEGWCWAVDRLLDHAFGGMKTWPTSSRTDRSPPFTT